MANGGTIPSNLTQTVTFYNTTPVIDKDKNVYFVPRFSKTNAQVGEQVRTAYLNAFAVVCPPSSVYSDIEVSKWSPQDRTLVVRGNIDDFRAVTDEGACLNYFIISRTVEKTVGETLTTQVFYYAFFITEVSQVGGGSVRITAVPDDFTNVFYLHNKHVLTQSNIDNDYEPFNEKMGNCYVARQHYDRVSGITFNSVYILKYKPNGSWSLQAGDTINISEPALPSPINYGDFKVIRFGVDLEGYYNITLQDLDTSRGTVSVPTSSFIGVSVVGGATSVGEISEWRKDESQSSQSYNPANLKIFMNQEESFKFKYQYRDYKYPISAYDGLFTKEEIEAIEEAGGFMELSSELRDKIILTCINYIVVETKSSEVCYEYPLTVGTTAYNSVLKNGELIDRGINRPNPIICFPFINSPEVFRRFQLERLVYMNPYIETFAGTVRPSYAHVEALLTKIFSNSVADYIHSVYIVPNVGIEKSAFSINYNVDRINLNYYMQLPTNQLGTRRMPNENMFVVDTGYFASGIKSDPTSHEGINEYRESNTGATTQLLFADVGFLVSGKEKLDYNISLSVLGDIPDNIKNNFYDPVLEAEPYKYYTISTYANYELVFKKDRYYQTGTVDVRYYYSVNGGVKVSYIPVYEVDEKSTPYFNEGLTFTIASSLPLVSDSYSSYYNQNKAQMKNQFAVADKNFQYDSLQKALVSAPSSMLSAGTRKGTAGFMGEGVNQLAGLINESVDYFQNKEIIDMNQKAKLADVGASPDTLKQAGSDVIYDLKTNENFLFLNHYTIDDMSYNSNAKLLERVGYQVSLYDTIHAVDRVGWNYVQLFGFDWKPTVDIMTSQENSIRQIFLNGVTLLHDKNYLVEGHNYETLLD